jgi:hypothetical protein
VRRFPNATAALVLVAAVAAERAAAQATGLPTFFAPTRAFSTSELGVTLSRSGGDATAVEGRLGFALTRADLNLRGGYADPGGAANGNFVAGIEARVPVLGHRPTFPLDGAFILGVGHHFEDGGGETFVPLGLSLGRWVRLDRSLNVTPYLQPTVILADNTVFALGLGVDVGLQGLPEVRVNWATGDMDGFSVSLFWGR